MNGVLGVLALAAVAGWIWKQEADVQELANKLIDALPPRLGQWGPQLASAANKYAPASVPSSRWALLLAAVMDRESQGGNTLKPRGASGTGDFGARKGSYLTRDEIAQVVDELPDGWSPPRNAAGEKLPPPYAIPIDGKGWGRGLMQLDLGTYPDLLNVTLDAGAQIDRAAALLRRLYLQLAPDVDDQEKLQRTAAAYNAGPRALTAANFDQLTTKGNYGADVVGRAAAFGEAFA